MPRYEFPASDSIDDHVPDDEEHVSVKYVGDMEIVETRKDSEFDIDPDDVDNYDRQELYQLAKKLGLEPVWRGDGADSVEDLRKMIDDEVSE